MDASFKKRVLKVTVAHLGLTVLIAVSILVSGLGSVTKSSSVYDFVMAQKATLLALLQPQFWLYWNFGPSHISVLAASILLTISVPLWSICFGWLFVKLDNWLNHFPVLGRRVF